MDNLAAQLSLDLPYEGSMIRARADMLRALIEQIPVHQRASVFEQVRDLLPVTVKGHPKGPHRGGEILNNVYELFRKEPMMARAAPEVQAEIEKTSNARIEPQAVRNALNYLHSRQVLQRIGYGRYRLADGSVIDGPP